MNHIETLVKESKWTALLSSLPIGETLVFFDSNAKIKSCKAVAYDINSDGISEHTYKFKTDKAHLCAKIVVSQRQ